jgi:hypothetical protein
MALRINKSRLARATLIIFFPLIYISQGIAGSLTRDNLNYYNFFSSAQNHDSLFNLYQLFFSTTGASEPLSFLYFLGLSKLGLDYGSAILVKNITFLIFIFYFCKKKFTSPTISIIFFIFLATDYYVFRLMSELHRLHLGIMLVVLGILMKQRWRFSLYAMGTLFHFQIFILAPLSMLYNRKPLWLITALPILIALLYQLASQKLSVYFGFQLESALKAFYISVLFLPLALLAGRSACLLISALAPAVILASFFFGSDRILLFLWHGMIVGLLLICESQGGKKGKHFIIYTSLLAIFAPLGVYRIWSDDVFLQ